MADRRRSSDIIEKRHHGAAIAHAATAHGRLESTEASVVTQRRANLKNRVLVNKAADVFHRFDENGDGSIDHGELSRLLRELDDAWTDERLHRLFASIDLSKDGRIQFDELLRWVFSGRGEEQPAFREAVGLNQEVSELIVVTVTSIDGEAVLGPEEVSGETTASHLRRRIARQTGSPVGCLCLGESILRDTVVLGAYCNCEMVQGGTACVCPPLELTFVSNVFSILSERSVIELRKMGALSQFQGEQCIRLGRGGRSHNSGESFGTGDEDSEFMLTADGRLLAKKYHYEGSVKENKEVTRSWRYEIAEGSFSLLDADLVCVELNWLSWAERSGQDGDATGQTPDLETLEPWQNRVVDEICRPDHLVPSKAGKASILHVARDLLKGHKPGISHYSDPKWDPLAGVPMPGITAPVLGTLDMDTANEEYWSHGSKASGPFL